MPESQAIAEQPVEGVTIEKDWAPAAPNTVRGYCPNLDTLLSDQNLPPIASTFDRLYKIRDLRFGRYNYGESGFLLQNDFSFILVCFFS